MYQLSSLVWKAYKLRLRSPLSTTLDVGGPILLIIVYLILKLVFSSNTVVDPNDIERTNQTLRKPLDVRQDLKRLICPKVLFFGSGSGSGGYDNDNDATTNNQSDQSKSTTRTIMRNSISQECGIELIDTKSRDDLLDQLSESLEKRISFSEKGTNLNRYNSSGSGGGGGSDACSSYQVGIIFINSNKKSIEVHSTEALSIPVIHQPYSLGSTYNEFRLPHGDINTGLHLLELCLNKAFDSSSSSSSSSSSVDNGLKVNIGAFPVTADSTVLPTLFIVFQLAANLCNALATVMRMSDDNEMGLHQYIRLSGVPASIYWTSQMIVIVIHMTIQSLIFACLLAIPIGVDVLSDPMYETSMTMRWALILSYAVAINAHALFVGSLFDRTSHAVLVTCLLAVSYAMYPILFMLQWNPYGFSKFGILTDLALLNPASNYEALLEVTYGIYLKTGEPFDWSQLGSKIDGGGMSDWSVAALWLLLLGQILFWFLITILYDHYHYSSSNNILAYLFTLLNDLVCCNYLSPSGSGNQKVDASKTKSSQLLASSMKSNLNPNRVCCSMRHVNILGPTVQVANTKGDPLKLSSHQLHRIQQLNHQECENMDLQQQQLQALKSQQYIIKRSSASGKVAAATSNGGHNHHHQPPYRAGISASRSSAAAAAAAAGNGSGGATQDEPIVLDEMLQQHIIWHKTQIHFENLNLEFKFNQVSFILGQTDYKELFFETLLGLRSLQSGQINIDGIEYTSNTISLARPQIGFLGEKDIFLNEMTIFENLQFFGSLRDPSYSQYDSESQFVLSLLHLTSRKDNLPVMLTNRSARKLALAAAAVGHTKLLLLVEPTLSLRWKPRCQVLNLLKKYKSIRSIVVDTSDVDEATAFGDRIVLFKNSQAYLDGSPQKLAKNLSCGHWIVFEPTTGSRSLQSNKSTISYDHVKSLELLTNEIFRQDKLEKLDATQRSVYEELMKSTIKESGSKMAHQDMNLIEKRLNASHLLHRTIVILKIQHSQSSNQSLCNLLKTFSANKNRTIHGFRLAEVTYESLEDVLVMNMAKAIYPDLPPDLLLSLQHRTQINSDHDNSQVSVRRCSSNDQNNNTNSSTTIIPKLVKPIYGSNIPTIIRDRLYTRPEIYYYLAALALALLWLIGALLLLQYSLSSAGTSSSSSSSSSSSDRSLIGRSLSSFSSSSSSSPTKVTPIATDQHSKVDHFYSKRVGLYIKNSGTSGGGSGGGSGSDSGNSNSNNNSAAVGESTMSSQDYLERWKGNKQFSGIVPDNVSEIDGTYVANLVLKTRDQAVAMIVHEPKVNEATIYFEPHQPRALMAGLKIFIDYYRSMNMNIGGSQIKRATRSGSGSERQQQSSPQYQYLHISQHYFRQPWHETIRGYLNRRLAYGLGFAVAEGISIAVLIMAPMRHRSESKVMRAKIIYWLAMLLFDMTISFAQVICYVLSITIIDGTTQSDLIMSNLLVLLLFKLVMIPVAYLVSLIIISRINGFLFILLLNASLGWAFSIHMRTLVEWSLISEGYLYTIANWIILAIPISSLIDSLTVINHIGRVDHLCSQVPAYTATSNLVELEGIQRINVVDKLLSKVRECLENGKQGIPTEVLHPTKFGVIYDVYFLLLFGIFIWMFLLFSERVFGLIARRFSSARSTSDPLKTIIRATEPTHSLFKWDREKDRLVSEYIRCMNEPAYVKTMASNCVYIRIWLKPMSDQSSIDKRLALILEPLGSLGQPRNDIHIELKTTLQVFVRVGSEANRHRMDRVQLIETYIKFVKEHSDMMMKFALLDWTRETLYKILLHGHYNTKSTSAVT